MSRLLRIPSETKVAKANMTRFLRSVNQKHETSLRDYHALYQWSAEDIPHFRETMREYLDAYFRKQTFARVAWTREADRHTHD